MNVKQISLVDFADDRYTIEQTAVRNKYEVMDSGANTVLRGNHEMFELKDEIHFTDGDGNDVFTVEAEGAMDIAGDYLLRDSQTEETVVVLDNDFSFFQDTWRIRDVDDQSVLAEINSRGALFTLARKLLPVGGWIPHKYEIADESGERAGSIEGQFSFKDRYEITIDEASSVPKEAIVAGAVVIDAIQGN
ncbi:MAG: hypothetical protein ACI91T_002810 [Natronomonas sp.]